MEGGRDVSALYAKGGSPLLMRPAKPNPAAGSLPTLVLRAYPGPDGVTGWAEFYEDDGTSRDYLSGKRTLSEVSYLRQGSRVRIQVAPTAGTFQGQPAQRAYVVELPGAAALGARLEGKPAAMEFLAREKLTRISIPARDIRQGFTLYVWLP